MIMGYIYLILFSLNVSEEHIVEEIRVGTMWERCTAQSRATDVINARRGSPLNLPGFQVKQKAFGTRSIVNRGMLSKKPLFPSVKRSHASSSFN